MTVIGHNHIRKVESFDDYEILAHPLPKRDERSFYPEDGDSLRVGVTYASHDVMIARPTGIGRGGRLAILMHHGGGRHALEFYEGLLPVATALLQLPEREQYALAYTIFEQADECAVGARSAEAQRWAGAYSDGRIRTRQRGRARHVFVETEAEKLLRRSR
ncbi:hypothetical protein [Sphingopyxis sp. 22461]|uniref:hypothetical protein n=1 Tax=Sphingopyxis sp. 22461 TaxID=3453923 RepID=UPI003F86E74B